MPYKCDSNNNLLHKKGGKWSIKQHTTSHENCLKAMGLLYGLESGAIKKKDVGKGKYTKGKMSSKRFKKLADNL